MDGVATQYVNIGDYLRGDVGALDNIVSWAVDGSGRLYAIGLDGEIFRFTPSAAAGDAGDTMRGGAGNDTIFGGAGDDRLNGGADNDTLNGGLGSDTASYSGAAAAVTVSLGNSGAQHTGGAGTDTLISIENLSGSAHDDRLRGDGGDNVLWGHEGGDTLKGNAGRDVLVGGRGADRLSGGDDNDTFVYVKTADSHQGHEDLITDLGSGDSINLGAIDADTSATGDQAFSLVSQFSHNPGELILVFKAGSGNTLLKGDVDGDGRADIVVQIAGDHTAFDNFVL